MFRNRGSYFITIIIIIIIIILVIYDETKHLQMIHGQSLECRLVRAELFRTTMAVTERDHEM